MNGSNVDDSLTRSGQAFVIPGQTAMAVEPGNGAFDDPTLRLHDKANLLRSACHDFQSDAVLLELPDEQVTLIAAIGQYPGEAGQVVEAGIQQVCPPS